MLSPSLSGPGGPQPPPLGLDASTASRSTTYSGAGQLSISGSGASRAASSSSRAKVPLGESRSSGKSLFTSETGELTMSSTGNTLTSMSMLSGPYRPNSGQQYEGPSLPASVGNVLSDDQGIGESLAGAAIMSDASTKFASTGGSDTDPRRSSTAYQSSELDYSTSAAGSAVAAVGIGGPSLHDTSRRASALTDITASTAPSDGRRDSVEPYSPTGPSPAAPASSSDNISVKSMPASSTISSRTTNKGRKKERNALRRTNSQSDLLKTMAGTGSPHVSSEDRSKRKSDIFLQRVREMQVEQRRKLIAVQEAEELRLQQQKDPQPMLSTQQQHLESSRTDSIRASNRALFGSGDMSTSSTSGNAATAYSNTGSTVTGASRGEGGSSTEAHLLGGPPKIQRQAPAPVKADDDSNDDSSSIHKFVSGILGMGSNDEAKKTPPPQEHHQSSSIESAKKAEGIVVSNVPSQLKPQQDPPPNTGQYLNEAAFVQHIQRQRASAIATQQQQLQAAGSVLSSVTGAGRSKRSSKSRRRSDEGLPLNVVAPIPVSAPESHRALYPGSHLQQKDSQQPPQPLHHQMPTAPMRNQYTYGQPAHSSHQQQASPTVGRGGYVITGPGIVQPHPHAPGASCAHCSVLERQLMSVQADLEYLRSVILQNEFVCAECEAPGGKKAAAAGLPSSGASVSSTKSKSFSVSSASRKSKKNKYGSSSSILQLGSDAERAQESEALTDASQRLITVAARHKRQVEHMTKETARWQNDMHLKLSKMSMMCKDLNDESAKRKEEALSVQTTLAKVRADRNSLQSEVESLRARIALYETEDVENDLVSQSLREMENDGLDDADAAIEERDKALRSMTSQLRRTLDSLELERRQQKERRQIIFPNTSQAKKSTSMNAKQANESSFFNPLLGMTRNAEEGHVDRRALAEPLRNEQSLQLRCEELERELVAAQEQLRKSTAKAQSN